MVTTCVVVVSVLAPPAAAESPSSTGSIASPASAAGAAPEERLAAYDEALVALTQELSYLVLLGWAAEPVPKAALELPAAIGIERDELEVMLQELRFLDGRRGPDALAALRAMGEPVTPAIETVLASNLPISTTQPVQGIPSIGVGPYLQAYDQLLVPWADLMDLDPTPAPVVPSGGSVSTVPATTAPAPATTSPAATVAVTTPVTVPATVAVTAPAEATSGDPDAGAGSSGGPMPWIAIAVLGVLVAAGGAWFARRSNGRKAGSDPRRGAGRGAGRAAAHETGDEVLDAGRTIMAAVDLDSFGAAVAEQVGRLSGTDSGVVIDGRQWTRSGRPLPDAQELERVRSTGRSRRAAGATLVPVVADGQVVGTLVAWTERTEVDEVLGAFAPLVGAALQGVRTRIEHEHLAYDDGLTGVGNRRRFDRDLERHVGAASGRGVPVALAMVDVDHFKRFNDTYGHQAGDAVLRHVAAVIGANVRDGDLVYRYGGEEFAVLLPGALLDEALAVAERVRRAVAETPLAGDGPVTAAPVTVSVGVSTTPPVDGVAMVHSADGALYAAKSGGRNRVAASPT